jgi:cytoskeletal protein RodZ
VTLLAPLKLTALKFSKLSIFAAASPLEYFRPKTPVAIENDPLEIVPPTPSEILEQIGGNLRQLREQHQLSIEDISARTMIQPRLVKAIEEGHIEVLPEPVYVKGMVKRYGDSLGLDGTTISQQVSNWEPKSATFEPTTKLQATAFHAPIQIAPLHLYFGYAVAIVGITAVTSGLLNHAIRPPSAPMEIATKPHQKAIPAVVKPAAPQPSQLRDIPVNISVKSPTWAQIGIDGTTKFTGNLKAGTKFNWVAKKQVTINTNNAGGLVISHDLQPPKPLGKIGQKQSVTIKVGK